jgi:cytochrome c-type biogenesis protein CcmH/NrfG
LVPDPSSTQPRGLPPRIYVPIVAVIAVLFLGTLAYFVSIGFGVSGAVFGNGRAPSAATNAQNVQGGPPAPVMQELATLRARIAAHPNDDVALTSLADNFLAVGKFEDAIPLYQRALKANPGNVAAKTGLAEARSEQAQANQ